MSAELSGRAGAYQIGVINNSIQACKSFDAGGSMSSLDQLVQFL